MRHTIGGYDFEFVTSIQPERDWKGRVREFMPQVRYRNVENLPLNRYGAGPFCRFKVRQDLRWEGVYLVHVDGRTVYVGECQDLSERFGSRGYGAIQPRNCFRGGQATNCRINNLILQQAQRGRKIELRFCNSADRKPMEASLIRRLQPSWNLQLNC